MSVCHSKTYLSVTLCHLSTDAVVIYWYVSQRGAEFQNITEETTGNFTAAIISDCERTSLEDPSPERSIRLSVVEYCLH